MASLHMLVLDILKCFDSINHISTSSDSKRRLLKKARNPPGSKSPLKFDTYTLNHAALVGQSEVIFRNYKFHQAALSDFISYSRLPG